MKLQEVLDLLTNCHVTVWQRNAQGSMIVVAKGFCRAQHRFEPYKDAKVERIATTDYHTTSITIE